MKSSKGRDRDPDMLTNASDPQHLHQSCWSRAGGEGCTQVQEQVRGAPAAPRVRTAPSPARPVRAQEKGPRALWDRLHGQNPGTVVPGRPDGSARCPTHGPAAEGVVFVWEPSPREARLASPWSINKPPGRRETSG